MSPMKNRTTPHWPDIAIIGSYPPPYGGISVHLKRFVDYLEREEIDYILYNTVSSAEKTSRVVSVAKRPASWYLKFLLIHRCKIVHLVSVNWFGRMLFGLAASLRPGKYVLSIHGRSITVPLTSKKKLRVFATRWLLRRMDAVVACNSDIERDCLEVAGLAKSKVRTIPAFIPPARDQGAKLPDFILNYIDLHSPIISAIGWIGQVHLGHDLYGIDMMVQLIQRLRCDYPRIGLILSVNGGQDVAIQQTVKDCRQSVGDSMLVVTESLKEFTPLAELSDLFLRPTNTDGDAVSIREALFVGTPVVTSNAAPRPEPCVLFANRDMDNFELQVRKTLSELDIVKERVASHPVSYNADQILKLYRELMEGTE